jgi:hypothetical protein
MRRLVVILCAMLPLACGCGRGQPTLAPVSGRVFYRGQPLAGGTIVFTPDPDRGGKGPLACGEIGADGRFTLSTGTQPGAVVGWHRVTVAARPGARPALPRRFSDPDLCDKCVEVKGGQMNQPELHLE